jgi:hypothetical protein
MQPWMGIAGVLLGDHARPPLETAARASGHP